MQPTTDPTPLDYAMRRAERSRKFWAGALVFAFVFSAVAAGAIFWVRSQAVRRQQLAAQAALQRQQQAQFAAALAAALADGKQLQARVEQALPGLATAPAQPPSNAVLRLPRVLATRTADGVALRLRNDHPAGDVLLDPADRIVVGYGDRNQFLQFLSPADLMPADLSSLAPGESGRPITVRLPTDAAGVTVVYQHTDSATGQRVETAVGMDE